MSGGFIPAWAEAEFAPKRAALDNSAELDLLREFYDCWRALHALPNDKLHRRQKERAAQSLVDAADCVKRFREPLQITSEIVRA